MDHALIALIVHALIALIVLVVFDGPIAAHAWLNVLRDLRDFRSGR
jgi:hypothetical protein